MGTTGLWDVLGKGEVHRIEDYAAAHWEKHKRPLRIAVDEACWRFSNLTDEQVQRIREGEPAANPIEKTILWRILKFWRLNIQLLFVTDGMRKPNKGRWGSGRGGGKLDDECIKMLHQMFDRLKVPYHQAPGEAEAECARLQQLGVVDAVWSDDGDCLMFGCTTMIKANRTSAGKKEWLERITVYQAETVLPRFNLDRDILVCFAVLTGGDYDTAGLPNCGFQTARKLAQRHVGLAYELKMCQTAPDFARWRMLLASSLAAMHKAVAVPPNFPNVKALNGYRNPAISTDEQCFNLRGLRGGWEWLETQIDQPKLRIVLRDHYDFTTKEYLKHMGPVFLARALTRGVTPARREENLSYGIQLRRTLKRKGQDGEEGSVKSELNIKFNAWMLVDINLTSQDSVNADGSAYDPMKPIDGVMLKCFLDHGLPEGALDKPESPTKKKGKARSGMQEHDSASTTPSASQSAPPSSAQTPSTSARKRSQDAPESEVVASQSKTAKKRRQTAEKRDYTDTAKKSRQRKPKAPAEEPPPPTFKRVDAPDFAALKRSCNVVDLDEEDTDDEIEIVSHPSQSMLSLKTSQGWQKTSRVPHWPSLDSPLRANTRGASAHEINFRIPADPFPSSSGTIDETVQDEASAAAMLRQRRERGLLSKLSSQTAASTRSEPPAPPRPPAPYEVIDLT